ncbi:hypothetical protein [Rosistilla oblonga]|uniref:Uncharacterized protein n=1 Tax=Rosistilla oblonga TaxID=2527990 RepID=A0A518J2C6_9BACT|nr:hypothetical protein [Rosistilla oblonga]QDV59489.1 hypothetical protein Mal33_55240 [Rosistilla oblonga]
MMSHNKVIGSTQWMLVTLVAVGMLSSLVILRAYGQEPTSPDADQKIQDSIRSALQGESSTAPAEEPLLGDVLDLIRRQGSILDGSTLDTEDDPKPEQAESNAVSDAHYRVAEMLLKTSRMLAALPGQDDLERQQLVRQMRREAAKCLQSGEPTPPGDVFFQPAGDQVAPLQFGDDTNEE